MNQCRGAGEEAAQPPPRQALGRTGNTLRMAICAQGALHAPPAPIEGYSPTSASLPGC